MWVNSERTRNKQTKGLIRRPFVLCTRVSVYYRAGLSACMLVSICRYVSNRDHPSWAIRLSCELAVLSTKTLLSGVPLVAFQASVCWTVVEEPLMNNAFGGRTSGQKTRGRSRTRGVIDQPAIYSRTDRWDRFSLAEALRCCVICQPASRWRRCARSKESITLERWEGTTAPGGVWFNRAVDVTGMYGTLYTTCEMVIVSVSF